MDRCPATSKDRVSKLSKLDFDITQLSVSEILFSYRQSMSSEAWFRDSLLNLSATSAPDTIQNLDMALSCIAQNEEKFPAEFLKRWINGCEYEAVPSIDKAFGMTIRRMTKGGLAPLSRLVTEWFRSNSTRLHEGARDLVQSLKRPAVMGAPIYLGLDSGVLSAMRCEDVEFTVKKVLGYVNDPKLLCSLVFSATDSSHDIEFISELVVSAFRSWIGYNYPDSALPYLRDQVASGSDRSKVVAESCIQAIEGYYEPLKNLARLREFQAPESRIRKFERVLHRLSRKYEKEAQSESVLRQICTTVPIKAGTTMAVKVNGETAMTEMNRYDFEIEVPRGEVIDPVGQHHQRIIWRHTMRSET